MTASRHIYSVSEITHTIKLLLEENIPVIWVEGEISNFKAHYSGHFYFTLKDERAQLSSVVWKSRTNELPFQPEDGMLVQALGTIRLYERSGRYQLDIIRMQPAGLGKLQLEFEKLKQKLQAEGMFEEERKKTLPLYPAKIGVVTSATGAALKDIINILNRRSPHVEIIVRPTKVQGEGAADDIARAIDDFNRWGRVDLLIVGRGGGSMEDLWAFNEEVVARAIDKSRLPVVSAVGHEIDFTISDFVADLRAPTPSAAAELVVPDTRELRLVISNTYQRINQLVSDRIAYYREKITALQRSYGLRRPEDMLKQYALRVDELGGRLLSLYSKGNQHTRNHLTQLAQRLTNLSPKKVLARGYSISYIDGRIVRNAEQCAKGDLLTTEISDGKIFSNVTGKEKND